MVPAWAWARAPNSSNSLDRLAVEGRRPDRRPARPAAAAAEPALTALTVQFASDWPCRSRRPRPAAGGSRAARFIDRAGEHDGHALAERLGPVGAGLVLGSDLLEVAHADDLHVGAGRDELDAVLGLAPLERPDAGPEPEEELGDLHARPLGREVVAELVQEDAEGQRHDDGEDPEARCRPGSRGPRRARRGARACSATAARRTSPRGRRRTRRTRPGRGRPTDRARGRACRRRAASSGGWSRSRQGSRGIEAGEQVGGHAPGLGVGGDDGVERRRRARRRGGRAWRRSHRRCRPSGCGPARNASTATSLAALSQAGAVPPARPAS